MAAAAAARARRGAAAAAAPRPRWRGAARRRAAPRAYDSRRVERVQSAIHKELSQLFVTDNEVRRALYPVERLGVDTQLTALASVSYVECDASLDVAKCYVTVYGDERSRTAAMAGLERKKGYLRTRVGKMLQIRRTPELRFIRDDSIERGDRTLALLAKMKASGDSGDFEEEYWGDSYFDQVKQKQDLADVPRATGRARRSQDYEEAAPAGGLGDWEKELDDEFAELGDVDFPLDDSLDDSETAEEIKR